jgi:histidinol-phosphate aminotransferase
MAAGIGTLSDGEYTARNCQKIIENREDTKVKLGALGFEMTDSLANFIFVRHPEIGGEELYLGLKEKGILVRHFSVEKIRDYCRITIGSREEMDSLISAIGSLLGGKQ